ncbi:MAG: response regulator, partial [Spirochaetota bacterium]
DGSSLSSSTPTTKRTIIDWTITLFVTVILAVTTTLTATFFVLAIGQVRAESAEQSRIVLSAVRDRAEGFLDHTTTGMRELGDVLFELAGDDDETLARIIDGLRIGSINLRSIDVIDHDARILYSSPPSAVTIGNDVSRRDAYRRVIETTTPAWSRVFYADFLNDVVATFYVPAGSYVLAGNLSLQRLWESMEHIDLSEDTQLSIIDSNGAYIYHSDLTKVERRTFAPDWHELAEIAESGRSVVSGSDTGDRFRTRATTIPDTRWIVAVHQNVWSQRRVELQLTLATLVVTGAALILGVWYIRRVARSSLEPFARLESIARRIADGAYAVEFPESRFTEITTLSDGLRSMVTAIEERELSLRDARDESERANRAKSELLANVSHEFRTSLNGVLGMNALLSKTELGEAQTEYLLAQRQAAQILEQLVDDLLEISRGAPAATTAPRDANLRRVIDSFGILARFDDPHVQFTWINDVPTGIGVRLDDERLGQIVLNLVSNARKFTQVGSVTAHWQLVTATDGQPTLKLTVRDTGIGIPAAERERVMESFVQIDSSQTKTRRGLGLGLAIVKRICDQAGGSVVISDNTVDGHGCEITVRIPAEVIDGPPESPREPGLASATGDAQPSAVKVVLVEDEAINRLFLATLLRQQGYEVDEYPSGVALLNEEPLLEADVLLMDIGLPHVSGLDAARTLRDRDYRTPIIALTAYSSPDDLETYRAAGMNGYVSKPVSEDTLRRVMRDVLDGAEWSV